MMRSTGVADTVRADFVQQVPQGRVGSHVDLAAQAHTHLGRIVSAQDVAVLDQSHLTAQTGGRQGRADAAHAAAYNHQVVGSLVHGLVGAQQGCAQGAIGLQRTVGHLVGGGQDNGVATAVEACQIVQGQGMLPGRQVPGSALLPVPCGAFGTRSTLAAQAEFCLIGYTVNLHGENAGRLAFGPESRPVLGAHQEVIIAIGRHLNRGHRIFLQRRTNTVRQQVTRPHLQHKLLLHCPIAFVGEGGRQDHHSILLIHILNSFYSISSEKGFGRRIFS